MRDALSESLYTLLDHLNRQWSQPPMNILEVIRNEFLHDLKGDHIAVDARGTPIARAADRAAVERAAPNATAYFSGADFAEKTPEPVVMHTTGFITTAPGVREYATGVAPIANTAPADNIGATDSATSTELTDEERKAILQAPSDMFDPEPTEPDPTYVPAAANSYQNQQGVDSPGAEQTAANEQLADEPPATDPAKLN